MIFSTNTIFYFIINVLKCSPYRSNYTDIYVISDRKLSYILFYNILFSTFIYLLIFSFLLINFRSNEFQTCGSIDSFSNYLIGEIVIITTQIYQLRLYLQQKTEDMAYTISRPLFLLFRLEKSSTFSIKAVP